MLSGAYLGNDPREVLAFEEWLGADVDYVRVSSGRANWDDYVSSVQWVGEQLSQAGRPLLWTVPMFANQGSLEAAAKGDYDHLYAKIAQSVLATSGAQDTILIRFGEEFNGTWMPWSAAGREDAFIEAYQNMVDAFRSVSNKFAFEWNVNIGGDMNPEDAYPGDDYVDIISMDFYYNTQWDPADPTRAWDFFVNRQWGLQWLEDFAEAHGKPTAYSEWGINADAPDFIEKAFEWFRDHDVVYQSYWYSNAAFPGVLDEERPGAAAAFLEQMVRELSGVDTDVSQPLTLQGGSGSDNFTSTGSATSFQGNDGFDTVTYGGNRSLYQISHGANEAVIVTHTSGGTDTLVSIERLTFSDQAYNLDIAAKAATIPVATLNALVDLYIAYFNRVPEASGLGYWIDQVHAGQTLDQIAAQFYDAGVAFSNVTGYSADMPLSEFIEIVYENVLDRTGANAPSQAEIAFWLNELNSGTVTREGLVKEVLSDARFFYGDPDVGYVPELLDRKVELGKMHAVTYGIDYLSNDEAITKTVALAAAVTPTSTDAAFKLIGIGPEVDLA